MNQNDLTKLQQIFDKYDVGRQGTVNMWQLKSILSEYGLELGDQELFTTLIGTNTLNEGELAMGSVVAIIYHLRGRNYETEKDQEIYYSWIAVGGAEDKSGYVQVQDIQAYITQFGLEINIQQLLYRQIEARRKSSIEMADLQIPSKLDYFEFKALLSDASDMQ